MISVTTELLLSEYFLIKAIVGKQLQDSENTFNALSKIFLVTQEEAERLYALTENDMVRSIETVNDFMQYQRLQKYSALTGKVSHNDDELEEIAHIKGHSILTASSQKLIPNADASLNIVFNLLSGASASGIILATRIIGFLQCEGIFLHKNVEAGIKKLTKTSNWNDCVSTLALLHYRSVDRETNMSRLRHEVIDSPNEEIYEIASQHYDINGIEDIVETQLLKKAFDRAVLKSDIYDSLHARILQSNSLNTKDKERLFFSLGKEQLAYVGDLPLKLSLKKVSAVDTSALFNLALNRKKERERIIQAFKTSDLRGRVTLRPICFSCDSKYILNMYAKALSQKNASTNVEIIDIAELSEYDLEPTVNNIFVRSVDEDKDNRFLLFFCGEIAERKFDFAKTILQGTKRSKIHLNAPNVTLDLSPVLPICFCDKANARNLQAYCEVIRLSQVSAEEALDVFKDILTTKQMLYAIGEVKLEGKVGEVFEGYDIDAVERLVDAILRTQSGSREVAISREIIKEYSKEYAGTKIGFGGTENGFGQ